jgi:hypothetical protein
MESQQEILAMLAVIYKKVDQLERKAKGLRLSAPDQHYLDELRQLASRVSVR